MFSSHLYSHGFNNTQQLKLIEFQNYEFTCNTDFSIPIQNKRLGKYAEELYIEWVKSHLSINEKLISNLQIIDSNVTLGELDLIIHDKNKIKHIEFCYKIYLYDPYLSKDEFHCWIGPNRRDSLSQKSLKLINKQLPLLNKESTTKYINTLIENFGLLDKEQYVTFLAQLYVSYEDFIKNLKYDLGKPDGFYLHFLDLNKFEDNIWFVPETKLDWLISPISDVSWIDTESLKSILEEHHKNMSNPLCWMRDRSGNLFKCFVVNWLNSRS